MDLCCYLQTDTAAYAPVPHAHVEQIGQSGFVYIMQILCDEKNNLNHNRYRWITVKLSQCLYLLQGIERKTSAMILKYFAVTKGVIN